MRGISYGFVFVGTVFLPDVPDGHMLRTSHSNAEFNFIIAMDHMKHVLDAIALTHLAFKTFGGI